MLVIPCLTSLKYTSGLRTSVFLALSQSGLWKNCVVTDLASNMLMQPSAAPACFELLSHFLAPVFILDSQDDSSFMHAFLQVYGDVVRSKFGHRTARTLECRPAISLGAYEVCVLTCVVATFQFSCPSATYAAQDHVLYLRGFEEELCVHYPVNVRRMPFYMWQMNLQYLAETATASSGLVFLLLSAYKELNEVLAPATNGSDDHRTSSSTQTDDSSPLELCVNLASVSILPTKSKEMERMRVAMDKMKDTKNRQDNEIAKLKRKLERSSTPVPSPLPPSRAPIPPPPPPPPPPSPVSSTIPPAPNPPAKADWRPKAVQRTVDNFLKNLASKQGSKARPAVASMKVLKEIGIPSVLASLKDMLTRIASVTAAATATDSELGLMSGPVYLEEADRVNVIKRSSIFTSSLRILVTDELTDVPGDISPAYVSAAADVRCKLGIVGSLIRSALSVMPVSGKFASIQTVLRAAIVQGARVFASFAYPDIEEARQKLMEFHNDHTDELMNLCSKFSLAIEYCLDTTCEHAERRGVTFLKESLNRVVGPGTSTHTIHAMSALLDTIPQAMDVCTDVQNLLTWISDTVSSAGDASSVYTGHGNTGIPEAFAYARGTASPESNPDRQELIAKMRSRKKK